MTAIKRLLAQNRLVTITGPGGCGKSRLAIQVATDLVDSYRDGVWFIDLTGVQLADLAAQAVGRVLGVVAADPQAMTDAVCAFLRPHQMLLVLDNCEHLITACAQLADAVLSRAAGVRIMATSRETLGISGEAIWPAQPLSVPALNETPPAVTDLPLFEATHLFVERSLSANPRLVLAGEDAAAVA